MPNQGRPLLPIIRYRWREIRPRHVRNLAGLVSTRVGRADVPFLRGEEARLRSGVVEEFTDGRIQGWVAVPSNAPAVRVSLCVNGAPVATAWATGVSDLADRNSWSEVRSFRFFLKDIWNYVRTTDKLTVRADDVPLPISKIGMFKRPQRNGHSSVRQLTALMDEGHVFEQYGRLSLSKQRDTEWQRRVMGLFAEVRAFVKQNFDRDLFFVYGTLLGAVRDNGFIGHDIDLDTAFVSDKSDGRDAAAELRDIAFALIDAGYKIESFRTHLHVTDADDTRIDIFHVFFDDNGLLRFPFGIAGTSDFHKRQWKGLREIDFPGGRGVVPVAGEELAAHLYGEDWRQPKPGFHWPKDRTSRASSGVLPLEWHEEIYWANFYAHTTYDSGSTFQTVIDARDDMPDTVIDIGCGDGRDCFAFGQAGRTVLGLDRSHIGVRHAGKKAAQMGLGERVDIRAVDVSHIDELRATLQAALTRAGDSPVLFYLRFFLHSIPEKTQDGLMSVISSVARPGDMLAAEFRTDKDEALAKVHTKHYRRYQNGPAFGAALRSAYGFDTIFEAEGTGLSPYGDEDPELYRVVARRAER
jgi:hypothetical protein